MPYRPCSRLFKSWLLLLGLMAYGAFAASAASAAPTPHKCDSRVNDSAKKLLPCIQTADLWQHMMDFQAIADANPGPDGHPSRNSGEPGYLASVRYVAKKMQQAGYKTTVQTYKIPYSSFVGTPSLSITAPTPTSSRPAASFCRPPRTPAPPAAAPPPTSRASPPARSRWFSAGRATSA